MSKTKVAELLKDERSGGERTPPGLSLGKILGDIGAELKHQGVMGSHELASALFRGDAFVMYPKAGEGHDDHGLPEAPRQQEQDGREM